MLEPPRVSPPPARATSSTRAVAHVLGVFVGLLVTPVAISVIAWSDMQRRNHYRLSYQATDLPALALLLVGAALLLGVGLLAVWAPLAPLVGGLVFGVVPAIIQNVQPSWIFRTGNKLPVRVDNALTDFFLSSGPAVLGVVLLGAGLAGMLAGRIRP